LPEVLADGLLFSRRESVGVDEVNLPFPELVELVLFFLAASAAFFVYDGLIRPWWRRGFGR
jgi:hypothetical protein